MQVGNDDGHPVDRVGIAQQIVVLRALLVGTGDHGLQRQISGLDQVPSRLRRLGRDPSVRVQNRDDQCITPGPQTAIERRDIQ